MGARVGLDIGYGNVKVTWKSNDDVLCVTLPAVAAPMDSVSQRLAHSDVPDGEVELAVDGRRWCAGIDPRRVEAHARALHADYVDSPNWLALARAGLSKTPHDKISMLVTGLPVSQMRDKERIRAMQSRLRGSHQIGERSIAVAEVNVVAQPIGTYFAYLVSPDADLDVISQGTVLVLDVGYYSVDWAVIIGGDLRRGASATSTQAMSVVIERTANAIAGSAGISQPAVIEHAIRSGQHHIFQNGKRIAITPYVQTALQQITPSLRDEIQQSLRHEKTAVDLVLLTGGGCAYYSSTVESWYAPAPLVQMPQPISANAIGYLHSAG